MSLIIIRVCWLLVYSHQQTLSVIRIQIGRELLVSSKISTVERRSGPESFRRNVPAGNRLERSTLASKAPEVRSMLSLIFPEKG